MSLDTVPMHSPEARKKVAEKREKRRAVKDQDILTYHQRGLVPLAIADKARVGLRRVVLVLRENGIEIPGYLTTAHEPPRDPRCELCGK